MDILPGALGSNPSYLTVHNGYLYFTSNGIDTSWMVTPPHRDACGAFRQSSFDPRVHFAVANNASWEMYRLYDCPVGYRWITTDEAYKLFPSHADVYPGKTYFDQCGWDGYSWGGVLREKFRFSDSASTGAYKSAGHSEPYRPEVGDYSTDTFAGVVCVTEGYLGVTSSLLNNELWRSDGTVQGTSRVDDTYPGAIGSYPSALTSFGGVLYYAATTEQGKELWSSLGDGVQPPSIVSYGSSVGIYPELGSSDPEYLQATETLLFFAATSPSIGK